MGQSKSTAGLDFTSPRLRGEVGAERRVRGTLHESEPVEGPPHPSPLPARGERENCAAALRGRS